MLPLNNNQISLLTLFWPLYTGLLHNDHLSITTAETLSPKWSLYTGLAALLKKKFIPIGRHLIYLLGHHCLLKQIFTLLLYKIQAIV